jgi:hypothetical protein
MKPLVDFAQPAAGHVGIDFCGAYAGVPEQLLDHSEVRPVIQQVRGETVAQHVRRYVTANSSPSHPLLDP